MPQNGPIIMVEDDFDDQEIFKEVFDELKIPNVLRFFNSCAKAMDYLLTTLEKPFLIISDINLPAMTGLDLRKAMNANEYLFKKSIPFIFLSTTRETSIIAQAYSLCIQGYFVKPSSISDLS